MELEFDKEIDAILRRARGGEGAGGNGAAVTHLDADAIVAFVENAVPETVRRTYTSHFADCTRCRKLLSQTILINDAAVAGSDRTAIPGVSDVVAAVPWYATIFRTPGLAVAMGALVITFTGILGYVVFRPQQEAANSTISQALEQEPVRSGPYDTTVGVANMASNANTAVAANTMPASSAPTVASADTEAETRAQAAPQQEEDATAPTRPAEAMPLAKAETKDVSALRLEQPKTAAPPPATATGGAAAPVDKKAEDERARTLAKEVDADTAKRKALDDASTRDSLARRDAPAPPAKSGPVRPAGPVQMQSNQVGNIAGEMPVKRVVGGKTFENRQGAWYDQSYRGQATTNYRRSSVEYKSLDSGLRSIADTLGGTVVVVWKGKAYRIN